MILIQGADQAGEELTGAENQIVVGQTPYAEIGIQFREDLLKF